MTRDPAHLSTRCSLDPLFVWGWLSAALMLMLACRSLALAPAAARRPRGFFSCARPLASY